MQLPPLPKYPNHKVKKLDLTVNPITGWRDPPGMVYYQGNSGPHVYHIPKPKPKP